MALCFEALAFILPSRPKLRDPVLPTLLSDTVSTLEKQTSQGFRWSLRKSEVGEIRGVVRRQYPESNVFTKMFLYLRDELLRLQ